MEVEDPAIAHKRGGDLCDERDIRQGADEAADRVTSYSTEYSQHMVQVVLQGTWRSEVFHEEDLN